MCSPRVPRKSMVTTGVPANAGAVVPSIVTVFVIAGSEVRPTRIVPATLKSIVLAPGCALAARIAWRSEPAPESLQVRHRERGQELPIFQDLHAPGLRASASRAHGMVTHHVMGPHRVILPGADCTGVPWGDAPVCLNPPFCKVRAPTLPVESRT